MLVRLLPIAFVLACARQAEVPSFNDDSGGSGADGASGDEGSSGGDGSSDGTGDDGGDDLPDSDHCGVLDEFSSGYGSTVQAWVDQDALSASPEAPLVFTGSSSIRRWEGLTRAYSDYDPVQRGFGGAQAADVALYAEELVNVHAPAGVVVFAGTNDVAAAVEVETVVARVRCLRERIWIAHGSELPVLFIGITPTPSRWSSWESSDAVNDAIEALAVDDPGLVYVDVPSAFLETGMPPSEDLFVSDKLHLSEEGYALWDSVLRPAVEGALSPKEAVSSPGTHPASGARVLVDLGADDGDNGEHTDSPDYLGQHWNNWHSLAGGASILPGEHLGDLVDSTGASTGMDLVITGGFNNNGRNNGGLLWPDQELLGDLAVGTATQDYFYSVTDDATGGLMLRGLDPEATYTLRFFASRDESETRATSYTVHGSESASATLQTSGSGAGSEGGNANDDDVAEFTGVRSDPWGHLYVDMELAGNSYAYVALMELTVE